MSTSWYKRSIVPKLLRSFHRSGEIATNGENRLPSIEVWNTSCIVTNFGKLSSSGCSILINPSNPGLTGVNKFPYFPRGGPEPKEQPQKHAHHIMGYVSQWGGMEVGDGMLFSANVIDGLVHQLGGLQLAINCKFLPTVGTEGEKCPVGHAVSTSPGAAELAQHYHTIVHTTPPFYKHHPNPQNFLSQCYQNSIQESFQSIPNIPTIDKPIKVAIPLLGAGCRAFPLEIAIQIAAEESLRWLHLEPDGSSKVLAFGIPEMSVAGALIDTLENISLSNSFEDDTCGDS